MTAALTFNATTADHLIIDVDIQSRYSKFTRHSIFNTETNKIEEIPTPKFEFTGDICGPIMPNVQLVNGIDVGARHPLAKLIIRKDNPLFDVLPAYNRAVYLGYYFAIFENYLESNGCKFADIKVYGFIYNGVATKPNRMKIAAVTSIGVVANFLDYITYAKGMKPGVLSDALDTAFGRFDGDDVAVPVEKSLIYEGKKSPAKKTDNPTIYQNVKLAHSKFPNGVNKYREVKQEPSPEMQMAKNWGIVIKMLFSAKTDNGVQYFEPSKPLNWVDHPELGFREVTEERSNPNYFIGRSIFSANGTTHFVIATDLAKPIELKYNLAFVANVFKLPEASQIGTGGGASSGYSKMDVNESDLLSMHASGTPATQNTTAMFDISAGVTEEKKSKRKGQVTKEMSDNEAAE